MILGRSATLWLGAALAIYGLAAGFNIGGFNPTDQQNALVTVAAGAVIALIAGSTSVAQKVVNAAAARAAKP